MAVGKIALACDKCLTTLAKKVKVPQPSLSSASDSLFSSAKKSGELVGDSVILSRSTHSQTNRVNGLDLKSTTDTEPQLPLIAQRMINWLKKMIAKSGNAAVDNVEICKLMQPENFNKIKFLETLTPTEKRLLSQRLLKNDQLIFFMTITGKKPACMLGGKCDISFLQKIKQNKMFADKFDVLSFKAFSDAKAPLTYIFNKKQVIETISRNKSVYTTRMNLDKNTSAEEIYKKLISSKDFLNPTATSEYNDLIGLTLGFPKLSTMVFNLEKQLNIPNVVSLRSKSKKYRKLLLKALNSENSPYKNLPPNEFEELQRAISNYKYKKFSSVNKGGYYDFVELAEEPKEIARINEAINSFNNEFTAESVLN